MHVNGLIIHFYSFIQLQSCNHQFPCKNLILLSEFFVCLHVTCLHVKGNIIDLKIEYRIPLRSVKKFGY